MGLFEKKTFVMHSGDTGYYKIECDALTEEDIETIAFIISEKYTFGRVYGVPTGAVRIEKALEKYVTADSNVMLIVDDVLTTGASMKDAKSLFARAYRNIQGVVIFARTDCPDWIDPIFKMWKDK